MSLLERPVKRPRVLTFADGPDTSTSSAASATHVTCTNNNARFMAARSVTIRSNSRNHKARRSRQKTAHSQLPESIPDQSNSGDADDGGLGAVDVEGLNEESTAEKESNQTSTKRPPPRPCQDWLPYRKAYLDELLRHDALGDIDQPEVCIVCKDLKGEVKCIDCSSVALKCARCMVESHAHLVLHRLERWNGLYFSRETLQNIGLRIQAGHGGGDCPSPDEVSTDFEVVDVSGQHTVTIAFCGCPSAQHTRVQLLRMRWFPASVSRPNTAFTFDVLNTFQILTLQGKISAHDFYQGLLHKTDNAGIIRSADGPSKKLRRSARGHDPLGIECTVDGECAVECPACPQPGKNLPAGWNEAPDNVKWLYALILTIDANFKLSLKEKGIDNDPALGDGWAHWVPREEFIEYLRHNGGAVEPNYCDSDLKAINTAARNTKDYKASGAGACLCGRHGLVRKNGIGSLQIGERYPNIDFIVFCTLVRCIVELLWFSYDIVCQWWRNLSKRVQTLPERMQLNPDILRSAKKVLPKFHEYNHGYSCQTQYSLNIIRYAGRTNGEDPERWWRYSNPTSMSTKEMGEGSREDTLDDFARSYNWRKITGFGCFYPIKLDDAIEMRAVHKAAFDKFDKTFPEEITKEWLKEVLAWDADHTAPNPYVEPVQTASLAALKLELAQEEAADAARGVYRPQDKTISSFLCGALDIQEEQRLLILRIKDKTTVLQASVLEEKRNTLRRRIALFRESQAIFMPGVVELRENGVSPVTPSAQDIIHRPLGQQSSQPSPSVDHLSQLPEHECLWLPSSIPQDVREQSCAGGVVKTETRMQLALIDDTLSNLRRQLRISSTIRTQNKLDGAGTSQRLGTRTQHVLQRFSEKIDRCAARYRTAYSALLSLDPDGVWRERLHELKPQDVCSPHRERDDDDRPGAKKRKARKERPSEGRRELSWIWLTNGPRGRPTMETLTPDQISHDMRAEWARMLARSDRWSEEVLWLVEEMRRILQYFLWKAGWWRRKCNQRDDVTPDIARGLNAYAEKQAALFTALGHSFAHQWHPLHDEHGITVAWPTEFIPSASL
ncbi:hypothetical protein HWV62_7952 [Athelia sp. TMB]|nr:hypothetical protein HWV62_7952 [Athelia sp. TMB]